MLLPSSFRSLAVAVCAAGLSACSVGPDFHTPAALPLAQLADAPAPPPATSAAAGPGGSAQRFVLIDAKSAAETDTALPDAAWWKAFRSDDLNRMVQQALDDSPTLAQAKMKLTQAQQDYLAQQGGTEFPQVDSKVAVNREKVDPAAFGFTAFPQPAPFTLYSASVSVSYTLDLFGANRRALEGLAAQVDYQRFEFDAARLTLAGNVVTAAVKRASLTRQIDLTSAIYQAQSQQLQITEQRYKLGGVALADLLSQRTQTEQTHATLPPLRQQLAQADHQLAVYLGRPPVIPGVAGDETNGAAALNLDTLTLPEELPLTLPSTLARERPDIRAAEALLHQASASVGVATANLYPQLTLSGSAGPEGTSAQDLLKAFNVWNIGAGLTQPLFHGGQLQSRKRSAEAAYEAALASYRQVVLQGLQQVADALRAVQHDADQLQSLAQAARAAHDGAGIASGRYASGGISQLALLDTQRQELQTTLDRVKVQAQRYADTAALYQALGVRP